MFAPFISSSRPGVAALAVLLCGAPFALIAGTTSDGVSITDIDDINFWSFQDAGLNVGVFDPVLFVEPDGTDHYMIVGDGNEADTLIPDNGIKGQDLYRSSDLKNWTKVADDLRDQNNNVISSQGGTNFNWGRKVGGTYYLYQSRQDTAMHLYTGTDPANLTYQGQVLDESDAGGFYDATTGTWHMYYESGNISGPSGDALGHATSPDGVNWTREPGFALNLGPTGENTGWKTGDADIIKVNETYHMFIDNTVNHPDYRIAWATSTDLYNWQLQEHAITHWPGGDAVVRYLPASNEFIMYQEYRGTGSGRRGIGYATAPAKGFVENAAIDPATTTGLRIWLKDAATDFTPGAGAGDALWSDSSGNGNDMATVAAAADADPVRIDVNEAATGKSFGAVQFADGATELMKSDLLGADDDDAGTEGSFTNLTIFTVYRIQPVGDGGDRSNMRPFGIGSARDTHPTAADNFNLASDTSIRKDNGIVDESDEALPVDQFFVRISRMTNQGDNADDIDEWLHLSGGELDLLQTRGTPFTTADDDFFLGDLRIDAGGLSGDSFAIAETLVYDQALTDEQILGIDRYLAEKYLATSPPEPSSPPNIIVFFSDDHTQQAISAYQNLADATVQDLAFRGWAPAQTPNIDRLADQGAIFRSSYVSNSICGPSRASLLTGLHSHANGVFTNNQTFDGSQQTLPKLLQSAGYDTTLIGKWHLFSEPTGFNHYERLINQGDYYSPKLRTTQGGGTSDISYPGEYVAQVITDRTIAWLQDRVASDASEPYFLMVNHKGTHREWAPGPVEREPATFRQVEWDFSVTPNPDTHPNDPSGWTPAAVPVATTFDDYLNNYPTRADGARSQEMEVGNHMRLHSDLKLTNQFGGVEYDEVRSWWSANQGGMTAQEVDAYHLQRYLKDYAMTGRSVDRSVGDILDFLEANDLDHNTIIIYASDQGFFLGEHGWYDKRWMYEESLRTPLLMQWRDADGLPVIAPGTVVDEKVQVIDYAPTVLDAAGASGFTPMHGESFLGHATTASGDDPAVWRDSLYYHYYEGAEGFHKVPRHYGVRTDRYKLIYHYEVGQWELFDLDADPTEVNNLLYDASTGLIDDPTDGVAGDAAFQDRVIGLMVELRDLRAQYSDTTGPDFSIPGLTEPGTTGIVDLDPAMAVYDGAATPSSGPQTVHPDLANGMTFQITFTPAASDLSGLVLLMEIGGNANGSGLYLLDGVPTFIQKQDSSNPPAPGVPDDTQLNEIAVQLDGGALTEGIAYSLAAIYDPPDTGSIGGLTLAIRPTGDAIREKTVEITGASSGGDWSGNETLSVALIDSDSRFHGGLSSSSGSYDSSTLASLSGTVERALYWNAVGSILPPTFADWIGAYEVGGQTELNDDPENDGLVNLFEFLFGTDPTRSSPWPFETGANGMRVVLRDLSTDDDITVTFESSTDLKADSWVARPDLVAEDPDQSGVSADFTRWFFNFDPETEAKRFVRIAAGRSN